MVYWKKIQIISGEEVDMKSEDKKNQSHKSFKVYKIKSRENIYP